MVFFNVVCRLCTSAELHSALQNNSITALKELKRAIPSILDLFPADMNVYLGYIDEKDG
jgi:hypothetical protein